MRFPWAAAVAAAMSWTAGCGQHASRGGGTGGAGAAGAAGHAGQVAHAVDGGIDAVFDPSCDEVVQFPGCCDLKQHKCGIMAGLRPGCVTESSFVTLPKSPKSCGLADAGTEGDAG